MKRLGIGFALLYTVLLGSLAFVLSADAQPFKAWPNDQLGRPAPPCMLYNPATGNVEPCSSSNAIPVSPSNGGTTSGTSVTGFGKAWYPSTITGAIAQGEQMIGLFIDDSTVAIFRRSTTCANCLQIAISQDGGVTGTFVSTTAILGQSISAAHRVPTSTPRYLVSSIAGPLTIIQSTSLTGTWAPVTGLAAAVSSWASNTTGSVVLSSDSAGNVCKSTDGGVSFGSCVAAANGALAFAGGTNWLLTSATAVLRSTNDGATWASVFTSASTKVSVVCLAPAYTSCLLSGGAGEITRSADAGATWPTQVDTGLGSPSLPALCDYGGGTAVAINLRSAPIGFAATTTDTHSSFNSGATWFPGSRFGSVWDSTGTPGGVITCRGGRGWVGITATGGGGTNIFAEYNPLTAPGGTLTSSAGGYSVAAPIQAGIILNTTPITSAANTAAAVTLTNTGGSRICIREIVLFSSAAATATLTVTDGATVVLNYGTVTTAVEGKRFAGAGPLVCGQTSNNLVVNIGAAGGVVTTTTSVIADRYPN